MCSGHNQTIQHCPAPALIYSSAVSALFFSYIMAAAERRAWTYSLFITMCKLPCLCRCEVQPAAPQPIREKRRARWTDHWRVPVIDPGHRSVSYLLFFCCVWAVFFLQGCQKPLRFTALPHVRANFSSTVSENESLCEICHCLEKRPQVSCPNRLAPFSKHSIQHRHR